MFTEEEFCLHVGIEQGTLQLWLQQGWLMRRQGDAGLILSEVDAARARLIQDLRDNLGVNDEGIGVVLNLIDQVHGLRSVLFGLLGELGSASRSGKA